MHIRLLFLTLVGIFIAIISNLSNGQATYPNRTVRWIVPSSSGGGMDIMTRTVAQKLTERMGQSFIVENRPGATGIIGNDYVAKSVPDGYTLVTVASTLTILPYVMKKLPYEVGDLAPITMLATVPNVLVVHPSVQVSTVEQFLALARREPGRLSYASAGDGSSPHMSVEALRAITKIDVLHIPYKGTGPALVDAIGGRTDFMMANVLSVVHHIAAGKLKPIGVSGLNRVAILPNIPTIGEAVKGYDVVQWYGRAGPKGTSPDIINRLQVEISAIMKLPDVKTRLDQEGAESGGNSAESFAAQIQTELKRWGEVTKFSGLKPQ